MIRQLRMLISGVVIATAVLVPAGQPAPSSAAPATMPHIAVYIKTYSTGYSDATQQFLDQSLVTPGYISYTVVSTLTQSALAGSVALVIDESCDESLNASEAALIHSYVAGGGRLGLFAWPGLFFTGSGLNPAAYQGVADLFGHAVVGDAVESDAQTAPPAYNQPYSVTGQTLSTYDGAPFFPITSTQTTAWLYSTPSHFPVAVTSPAGLFMSNSIGDEVEGGDANQAYSDFIADAIVWLAGSTQPFTHKAYLPVVRRP